jgi:hypothetical protein
MRYACRLLSLESNQLTGTLPSTISGMSALQSLLIQNNMLSGSIPSGISTMKSLR